MIELKQIADELNDLNRPSPQAIGRATNRYLFSPHLPLIHDGFKWTGGKMPPGMMYPVVKTERTVANFGNVEGEEVLGYLADRRGKKARLKRIAIYPGDWVDALLGREGYAGAAELMCLRGVSFDVYRALAQTVNLNFQGQYKNKLTAADYYEVIKPLYSVTGELAELARELADELMLLVDVGREWCEKHIQTRHQEMDDKSGRYDPSYTRRDYAALYFAGLQPRHNALDFLAASVAKKEDDSADKIIGALVKHGVIKPVIEETPAVEEPIDAATAQQRHLAKARAAKAAKDAERRQGHAQQRNDATQLDQLAATMNVSISTEVGGDLGD